MDGSASRAEGNREEGRKVKDVDAGPRWVAGLERYTNNVAPTLRKKARRMGPHIFKSGFYTKTSELVTPKDKSGHAEDHGVGG